MRNVLITGGSRGLGLATAQRLADAGHRVIAVARREGEALAAARQARPERLLFRACDLADTAGLADFVASLTRDIGPVWGLVNNAGIGPVGILATMPDADIEAVVRLNLLSPILLTRECVRAMMAGGAGGRIVNVSSIVARTGYPGLSVYAASKAALGGFTGALARELGRLDITVNCVAPGFIATEMTHGLTPAQRSKIEGRSALKRLAEAADVAAAIAYLLSDDARNVTGTTLTVDAGNTA